MQLAFTAESDASINHSHLFSDFKFSKELNFHSDQPLFLIRWVFLVWRNALLGVITDLQTRHTLVATTQYFSLSYLRLILCASQITYTYLWILVCAFGSDHRPSLAQTGQDTLLWPLLCTFPYLWVTMSCFFTTSGLYWILFTFPFFIGN